MEKHLNRTLYSFLLKPLLNKFILYYINYSFIIFIYPIILLYACIQLLLFL